MAEPHGATLDPRQQVVRDCEESGPRDEQAGRVSSRRGAVVSCCSEAAAAEQRRPGSCSGAERKRGQALGRRSLIKRQGTVGELGDARCRAFNDRLAKRQIEEEGRRYPVVVLALGIADGPEKLVDLRFGGDAGVDGAICGRR
jgi:hypothetical protein